MDSARNSWTVMSCTWIACDTCVLAEPQPMPRAPGSPICFATAGLRNGGVIPSTMVSANEENTGTSPDMPSGESRADTSTQ
ncbi:hypothetical protein C8T65DRAFT_73960 [Cerioporus squamosus]|nr:hypothetical protein C8T65DRAFT_73960 [Cerioporus squamosus]